MPGGGQKVPRRATLSGQARVPDYPERESLISSQSVSKHLNIS